MRKIFWMRFHVRIHCRVSLLGILAFMGCSSEQATSLPTTDGAVDVRGAVNHDGAVDPHGAVDFGGAVDPDGPSDLRGASTPDVAVANDTSPLNRGGDGNAAIGEVGAVEARVASVDEGGGVSTRDGAAIAFESTPAFDGSPPYETFPNSAVQTVTVGTTACSDGRVLRTTEFPLASVDTNAYGISAGPDGNLWFAECFVNKIGRITSNGTVTEFPAPTPGACPMGITSGPDGNLWFTELYAGQIGRITPQGTITEFAIPTADGWPFNITVGPDDNLWFTERQGNKIGRISTHGTVAEFAIPPAYYAPQTQEPWDIAAGADGNLWFTYGPNIGRATPVGAVDLFPVPTQGADTGGITAGPGGNLCFTEVAYPGQNQSRSIGRVSAQATITELVGPAPGGVPGDIVAGPDGSLWFTEAAVQVDSGRLVGRMSPDGTFAECPARRANIGAEDIAVGPDGNLWFTEPGEIIRIEL